MTREIENKKPYQMTKAGYLEENRLGGSEIFREWRQATGRSGHTARDKNDLAAYRKRVDAETELNHRFAIKQAIRSGKLTKAEYKKLYENDYGKFIDFMHKDQII